MDSLSRQYYERSLGAGMFVSPETENGLVGYSEPLRRFIQHEGFSPQVNEIQNQMPSWIPGEDHLINFQKGDPYVKLDEGYARLPGDGYTALHPELEGVDPEDYPDITKLSILGDVAPYSREYNRVRAVVEKQSRGDEELRSRYEQIVEQVRQTKESTLQVDERRFDAPVDQISGTVKSASFFGVELVARSMSSIPGPSPEQHITPRARAGGHPRRGHPPLMHRALFRAWRGPPQGRLRPRIAPPATLPRG